MQKCRPGSECKSVHREANCSLPFYREWPGKARNAKRGLGYRSPLQTEHISCVCVKVIRRRELNWKNVKN